MSVYLVGAGPGPADLLTVRAVRILERADVVVHDRLVDPSVLALAPATAELIDVGKVPGHSATQDLITELLIALGRRHGCVVRLKGGDPFVFGRGGEEELALRAAEIEVEVVPGVTSAFAAPAAVGIPVTHRDLAAGVVVVTGHGADGTDPAIDWASLATSRATIVVLMGVERRGVIAQTLIAAGMAPGTPAAAIERAWSGAQKAWRATLADLGEIPVANPAVLVIGDVVALADPSQLEDLVLSLSV